MSANPVATFESVKRRHGASTHRPVEPAALDVVRTARPQLRRILQAHAIQPKLTVGPPDDELEREADRVADQVMRMPDTIAASDAAEPPQIQRKCKECEEEEHVQRMCADCAEEEATVRRQAATPAPTTATTIPPDIAALDLETLAQAAAVELRGKQPTVTFTSGRRTVPEQASAMAANILSSGNRNWITATYVTSAGVRALQKWLNDNPTVTDEAGIAAGLTGVLNGLTARQQGYVSKHLLGRAFDVQPVTENAEAIKADMRGLTGIERFLEREADLVRWHAQFKRENRPTESDVPDVTSDVESGIRSLQGGGQALPESARRFFEARFGRDFRDVRIHADTRAANTARTVQARAFTLGSHVSFADGEYAPQTHVGRELLAHELTHVLQQSDSTARRAPIRQGLQAHDLRDTLRRKDGEAIDVELVPSEGESVPHVDLPKVSAETWRLIGGSADNAGMPLSEPERQKIAAITKQPVPSSSPLVFSEGPRFLLHDTAALLSAAKLAEEKKSGRGPLGAGVTAWIPRAGDAERARSGLFETRRPSTTEFEKAADIIEQGPREKAFRQVWNATLAAEQTAGLDRALDGLGLTEPELKTEKKNAQDQLSAASGKIFTTAAWTVGEICARVAAVGAKNIAASAAKEADLTEGCKQLAAYFRARASRVGSMVTVEILQESGLLKTKAQDKTVSENTCDPANPNLTPLPKPAYTDSQVREIVLLYLRACLEAGRFPQITTHFVVDAFKRGHCDPRCFDLNFLYQAIALNLGHGARSTYGVKPSYGTTWGTNTVWWNNTICGGPPPSP